MAYAFDLGYAACWFVHVMEDSESHLLYLRTARQGSADFYIYQTLAGKTLTMYFEGSTREGLNTHSVPPKGPDGRPSVDGYVEYETWTEERSSDQDK
jgi:hypothetical protein